MILGARPITLRRYSGGHVNTDGRWDSGTATDSTIFAGVQSADDEDMQKTPDLYRRSEGKRIYTSTPLHTVDQYGANAADRLVIDGVVFVCVTVNSFEAILPHDRVICARLEEGQS
jgi:hypothetical protein